MKRFARRRSAAAVLALVVALCALVLSTGSAARLDLSADGSIAFAQGAERCTDGPLTVSPTGTPVAGRFTEVTVSGITGDCSGGNVSVYQLTSPHAVLFSGAGSVSGSTMKVTAGAFTPAATGLGVVVGLDGWAVPAVWKSPEPGPASAIRCYPVDPSVVADCQVVVTVWNHWTNGYRLEFRVESSSPRRFAWEVEMDFSATGSPAPGGGTFFPGDPVPDWDEWNRGWRPVNVSGSNLCAVSGPQNLPKLRVRGPNHWNGEVGGDRPQVDGGGVQVTGGTPTVSLPGCS